LCAITTGILFRWSYIEKASRPYSTIVAIWSLMVTLGFTTSYFSLGFGTPDRLVAIHSFPTIAIGSIVVLFVIGCTELWDHRNKR
jgi:hypothetical protein